MYKVIHDFADMQDNGYLYHAGDTFPRNGVKVDSVRTAILLSNSNRTGVPLIAKADETPRAQKAEKHRGRRKKLVEE